MLLTAGLVWNCTAPEETKTTLLYYYTPYSYAPEFLNGQVKSVSERTYWATDNNGELQKGDLVTTEEKQAARFTLDFIAHFDMDGNINQVKYILDNNKFNFWNIENLDGKLVKASFIRDDTVRYYQKIEHEGLSETITNYRMPEDQLFRTYELIKNEAGIATQLDYYNAENEKLGYGTYELNDMNRVINYKRFNAKDSLLAQTKMTYGEDGFYLTLVSSDGNGIVDWDGKFEYLAYDERGNWTSSKTIHDGELKFIIERKYEYY